MKTEDRNKMWVIDHKAQVGDKVTDEEKEFFNANFEKMRASMEDDFNHWRFHASKFKTTTA